MSENYDLIAIFPIFAQFGEFRKRYSRFYIFIYGQFGAIWKLDSGRIVCKTDIFININLLSYKKWKQN